MMGLKYTCRLQLAGFTAQGRKVFFLIHAYRRKNAHAGYPYCRILFHSKAGKDKAGPVMTEQPHNKPASFQVKAGHDFFY